MYKIVQIIGANRHFPSGEWYLSVYAKNCENDRQAIGLDIECKTLRELERYKIGDEITHSSTMQSCF